MAFKLRPAVMVLLVAMLVMLVIQPHLAAATGSSWSSDRGKKGGSSKGESSGGTKGSKGGDKGHDGGWANGGGNHDEGNGGSKGGDKGSDHERGKDGGGNKGHHGGDNDHHGGGHGEPNCKKDGSMCGDPKIVGGDGVTFYFHGHKNEDFCLVSDSDLHINAHFIGKRPERRTRDSTWVQALGFVFGSYSFTIAAKPGTLWDSKVDQLKFSYNGIPFSLDKSSWQLGKHQIEVVIIV